MSRLDEIKARAEKATPGPWKPRIWDSPSFVIEAPKAWIFQTVGSNDKANAEFVAHAREDVPWLLEIVKDFKIALELIARDRPTQEPASIAERALARLRSGNVEEKETLAEQYHRLSEADTVTEMRPDGMWVQIKDGREKKI